jgi:hypothetical protein
VLEIVAGTESTDESHLCGGKLDKGLNAISVYNFGAFIVAQRNVTRVYELFVRYRSICAYFVGHRSILLPHLVQAILPRWQCIRRGASRYTAVRRQEAGNHLLDVGGTELQASFTALAMREMPEMKRFRGYLAWIGRRKQIFFRRAHELDPFWTIIVYERDSAA